MDLYIISWNKREIIDRSEIILSCKGPPIMLLFTKNVCNSLSLSHVQMS
jgi:hypothetical protein